MGRVSAVIVCVKGFQPALQRSSCLGRLAGGFTEGHTHGLGDVCKSGVRVGRELIPTGRIHGLDDVGGRQPFFVLRFAEGSPGRLLFLAHRLFGLLSQGLKLLVCRRAFFHEELAKLGDAVEFLRPSQTLFRLVPFVRTRRAVPLGLGDFLDVNQDRNVVLATTLHRFLVRRHKGWEIPPLHAVNQQAVGAFFPLKPCKSFGNALLDGLVLLRHRNAVAVVPHVHEHGHLQDAGGVHGLPEHPFRRARVTDGADGNLVAAVGELGVGGCHVWEGAVHLARLGQTQQARHLRPRGGHVGRAVEARHLILPIPKFIQHPGGEVAAHLPPARGGVGDHVGVGVQGREVLLHGEQTLCHHEGLVPVVPRTPVPWPQHFGERQLRQLLAVPEDPKLRLAREHFFAAEQGCFTAGANQCVILDQLGAKRLNVCLGGCGGSCRHGCTKVHRGPPLASTQEPQPINNVAVKEFGGRRTPRRWPSQPWRCASPARRLP